MFGTKVEITLAKAEPGNWVNLDFPRKSIEQPKKDVNTVESNVLDNDSDVDLDEVEAVVSGCKLTEID